MIEEKERTIQTVDSRMEAIVGEDLPILAQIKEHVIKSGGKRLRPLLHHYYARILGYKGEDSYDIGAIGELIHAASLLHDDVVDDGLVRRGKPTPNASHGNKVAVLAGDYLFSCALDHLSTMARSERLVPIFTGVIRMLSIGELIQMQRETDLDLDAGTYDRIIHGKTGSLFGAMLAAATVLVDKDREQEKQARLAGEKLGHVFQIRDDFLDYFSDRADSGKEQYQDFRRGIITRPIILLRDSLQQNSAGDRTGELRGLWDEEGLRNSREGESRLEALFHELQIRRRLVEEIQASLAELKGFIQKQGSSIYSSAILKQIDKLNDGVN